MLAADRMQVRCKAGLPGVEEDKILNAGRRKSMSELLDGLQGRDG